MTALLLSAATKMKAWKLVLRIAGTDLDLLPVAPRGRWLPDPPAPSGTAADDDDDGAATEDVAAEPEKAEKVTVEAKVAAAVAEPVPLDQGGVAVSASTAEAPEAEVLTAIVATAAAATAEA